MATNNMRAKPLSIGVFMDANIYQRCVIVNNYILNLKLGYGILFHQGAKQGYGFGARIVLIGPMDQKMPIGRVLLLKTRFLKVIL